MYAAHGYENAQRRAFYHAQQRNLKRANDLAAYLAQRQRKVTIEVGGRNLTVDEILECEQRDHEARERMPAISDEDIQSMYDDNRERMEQEQ